ncbi:MAG: tyrosine-protein phosphatase [Pseudomonadota bacterium]
MASTKRKKRPHIPADLATIEGRHRAHSELIWGDHGFLRFRFSNLHQVSDELWRSNQPSPIQIHGHAENRGIKTVVNLRGESTKGYYLLEKEACTSAGISLIDHQVFSRDTPTRDAILGTRDIFESIQYPALIHCKSGADRAGLVSCLYKIFRLGSSVQDAIEQLSSRYLHIKQGKTGVLDAFFEAALRADANTPDAFLSWVLEDYERVSVKADFLRDRGRTLELDRLLGRE